MQFDVTGGNDADQWIRGSDLNPLERITSIDEDPRIFPTANHIAVGAWSDFTAQILGGIFLIAVTAPITAGVGGGALVLSTRAGSVGLVSSSSPYAYSSAASVFGGIAAGGGGTIMTTSGGIATIIVPASQVAQVSAQVTSLGISARVLSRTQAQNLNENYSGRISRGTEDLFLAGVGSYGNLYLMQTGAPVSQFGNVSGVRIYIH